MRQLKNLTRQRRSFKRHFEDVAILLGEANFIDDALCQKRNERLSFEGSVCLTMSVSFYLPAKIEYLQKGFQLGLIMT